MKKRVLAILAASVIFTIDENGDIFFTEPEAE